MNDGLMERRTLDVRGIQVRDAEDGDGSILTGIAVPFNTRYALWGDYAEVFDPDTDFGSRDSVKISRQHGELIGRVTSMDAEADGLHITAKLAGTQAAREAIQLVREGVYDGFSVGFIPVDNREVAADDGVTEVHRRKVDLFGWPSPASPRIRTRSSPASANKPTKTCPKPEATKPTTRRRTTWTRNCAPCSTASRRNSVA